MVDPELIKTLMTESGERLAVSNGTLTTELLEKYGHTGHLVTVVSLIVILADDPEQGAHVVASGVAMEPSSPREIVGELMMLRGKDLYLGKHGDLAEIQVTMPNPRYNGHDAG